MNNKIDWTDPSCQVTSHFTVKDMIFLHNWNRLATEVDGVNFEQILATCQVAEKVRSILKCPMNITSFFRSKEYNKSQGIKEYDVHARSMAFDFDCQPLLSCNQVKDILEPLLDLLGIRMERNGDNANWVHIDVFRVGPSGRYFTP